MRRLLLLAAATLVAGFLVAMLLRSQSSRPEGDAALPVLLPRFEIEAELTSQGLQPYRLQVPKDHEVHLLVRGGPDAPEGMLVLLGYEDLTPGVDMGPGQGRELVFTSSRPGDDFALSIGGKVLGRLEVTGGHLEEGHQ
jgi:hypothetical protein